eukprot:9358801-Pyramimonas_sp.AAC.1
MPVECVHASECGTTIGGAVGRSGHPRGSQNDRRQPGGQRTCDSPAPSCHCAFSRTQDKRDGGL